MLCLAAIGTYFVARFGGRWAENDSAVFTDVIRSFMAAGRLVPAQGDVYASGYTYQAVSAFVLAATGLEVSALQQLVYPLLSALVMVPAWLLYRELLGSRRGATLATLLLLGQPEFLFVVLRKLA